MTSLVFVFIGLRIIGRFVGTLFVLHGERRGDAVALEEQSQLRADHHHARHHVRGRPSGQHCRHQRHESQPWRTFRYQVSNDIDLCVCVLSVERPLIGIVSVMNG